MKIISVANQKGGVSKTTTTVNLATYLAHLGQNVLLIDMDPQANATSASGIDKESVQSNIYDVLVERTSFASAIMSTEISGYDVLPAQLSLVGAEIELVSSDRREHRLRDVINKETGLKYDYVFIDTPPSLGLLTINALTASNSVLIPMQCEYFALEGLAQLYKTIQLVKRNTNPDLDIEGLVFSMVDARSNLTVQVIEEVKKFLKEKVYETSIPRNIRLAEAPGFGKPILLYDRTSKGAEAYEKLAREFLGRNGLTALPLSESTTAPTETSTSGENQIPVEAAAAPAPIPEEAPLS